MQLPGPIVSTDWLAQHIDDDALRVFDVSIFISPNDPEPGYTIVSGRDAWEASHIPGAGFLDLMSEFSDQSVPLPMTMLSAEIFADRAAKAGIGHNHAVVVYSAQSMMFSTRFWWMLRSMGFDNVAVLDGGWNKWRQEARQTTNLDNTYPPANFNPTPRPDMWADRADVLQAMQDQTACILYALEPEVYNGEIARYGRPGHIPGSHNVYYNNLIDSITGTFLPIQDLSDRFVMSGAMQKSRAVIYCGGGVAATMDALALTMLGHSDIAVYDGSMSEWASDPSLPLHCGDSP
jgi:thiosulfate/3-mercaptopyruvate sulfurtransferase